MVSDVADGLLNNDTDPDHLDVLTVTGFDATSQFGAGVTVNPDGTYNYDATSAAFLQALAVGETALDTFSYTISDLAGVESTSTVTIEVTGVNDAPVITDGGDVAGDVQEDVTLTVTGDLDSTDVDNGATAEWSVEDSAGTYGSLAVDADTGTWTYTLDNTATNVQALAAGESHDETFTVVVTDEHGATDTQTVTVTVTGTNDAPIITTGGDIAGAVQEDATLSVTGDLDSTDVDNGATATWSVADSAGTYGSLAVDVSTGTWTYTLDNNAANVQALAQGESHDEVFTVVVTDDQGATDTQTVTVTVNGTNDAPVITAQSGASITNGSFESGLAGWTVLGAGVDAVGNWDASDGSVLVDMNALNTGGLSQTLETEIGATYTVYFDLSGNPDAQTNPLVDPVKDMTVSAAGVTQAYSYDVTGNTINDMNWEQQSFTFVATSTSTELVFSSLEAGPRGATIDNVQLVRDGFRVQEDDVQTVSGDLDATDIDNGAILTWSVDGGGVGTYGSLAVDSNGTWTYTLNNGDANVQALAQGESQDEIFTVVVTDEFGASDTQTVTVTVTGTNDAPAISIEAADSASGDVSEDGVLSVTGSLTGADVDNSAVLTWSGNSGAAGSGDGGSDNGNVSSGVPGDGSNPGGVGVGDSGGLGIGNPGGGDVNPGGVGVGDPGGIGIGVGGVGAGVGGGASSGGSSAGSTSGGLGAFTVDQTGVWTYELANNSVEVQSLAEGETATETYTVTLTDEHGASDTQDVTITVTGQNDGPDITAGGDVIGRVDEDGIDAPTTVTGDLDSTDVDNGATATWLVVGGGDGTYGDLSIDPATGTWIYDLRNGDANVQALARNEARVDAFTVEVRDEHGATDTQEVRVTVTGTNDDPIITEGGDVAGAVQEDTTLSVTGDLDSTDVDNGATAIWSVEDGAGTYGDLSVDTDGTWTYVLRNGDANVQALAAGESHDEEFTVVVTDDQGAMDTQTVTVTVNGTNDAPRASDIHVFTNITPEGGGQTGVPIPNPGDGTLITGLGGVAGFGENVVSRNDDGNSGEVDLSGVFGDGLNFFGTTFSSIYINTNGNISFGSPVGQFTPSQIGSGIATPIIAPYWADVDTRGGTTTETPGGTSTGANQIWYDLDETNGVLTVTWDDVGYFSSATNPVNAFQLQLFDRGGGDFDVVFRYEDINWTTGGASGGSGGLGGTPARAGYSAGNGTDFFELPSSGDQNAMLDLENAEGNFDTGIWAFQVRDGGVSEITAGFDFAVSDGSGATDTASVIVHSQEGTSVTGAATDDILISETTDDLLTGNAGDDLFVFTDGHGSDTITDFQAGAGSDDALDLSGISAITDLADLLANHASDVGSNTVIDTGNGNSITLIGVSESSLHEDDFLF